MEEGNFLTKKEKEQLEKELQEIKEVQRPKVIERLQIARSFGDLSENSEYESARKDQASLEGRISEVEGLLKNATVIEENAKTETVSIGRVVTVEITGEGKKKFGIESDEGDISISAHSPIAIGLLGKRVGDVVTITLPKGDREMKVTSV